MQKIIRNISIFAFISLSSGWLGLLIDKFIESSQNGDTLGMGIWLVLPLIATLLLRMFAGDGWKDIGFKPNFKGNIRWYFVSLIIFPCVTASILLFGKIFGWINFTNFRIEAYFTGFLSVLIINFVKNIFEETVWRGYLTGKLLKTRINDIWLYLIVGGIWALWHLPYFLYFLPSSVIHQVLPAGRITLSILSIFTMICWSVMYVELFRLTRSIWPVVLLHMIEDSLINHLVIDGHITITFGKEILISPIYGIITSMLYIGVGLLIRYYRTKSKKSKIIDNFN